MNKCELEGYVYTVPIVKLLRMKKKTIPICKYVLAVEDKNTPSDSIHSRNNVDFFECVAFGDNVDVIKDKCEKGAKISLIGKMKNHRFEDNNKTIHFTNVFLTMQINSMECSTEDSLKYEELYASVCDEGFLCIDEADYYQLATML